MLTYVYLQQDWKKFPKIIFLRLCSILGYILEIDEKCNLSSKNIQTLMSKVQHNNQNNI
jgi:hypothetical protein